MPINISSKGRANHYLTSFILEYMNQSVSPNNKRIAKNTLFLYIRMFVVLIVSLYTSRVVLNCLGISDYGIFSVVSGFVSLFGFLSATLSASMQRFYNYELGQNQSNGIQNIYSTGFWIHAIVCVITLLLLETFGIWYINCVLNVDNNRLFAANVVFQTAVVSLITIIMQSPYLGAVMAYEKMGVYSFVSIFDTIFKLIIAILLQYSTNDKLILYSILLMTISVVDLLIYIFYSKLKLQGLHLSKKIDKTIVNKLLSFSGWNLLGTFAFMINGQGLNLLLNSFFGTVVNAARGVAFQVNAATTSFTSSITTAFRPQVVESYARGDASRVKKLFYTETKICFSLVLFLIIPLILEIDNILKLWLGEAVPPQTNIFTTLVLINTLICTINPIIGQVAFANGKIKRYQIANSIVNILIIPVAWLFLELGASAVSVFIITIVFSIINQTVCIIEMNRLFDINLNFYLRKVLFRCFLVALCATIPQLLIHIFLMNNFWIRFIFILSLDLILILSLLYFILFTNDERELLKSYIKKS